MPLESRSLALVDHIRAVVRHSKPKPSSSETFGEGHAWPRCHVLPLQLSIFHDN